ncbi:MAG: ATP-binding protein [Pyrobaculum sp.]
MKSGEELSIYEIEKLDAGSDFKLALSRSLNYGNVYLVGPPGSGKTTLLRKLGISLSRAGRAGLYIKLEWVKYGWGLEDYVEKYGDKNMEFIEAPASLDTRLVLLDDGELLWSYPSAYRKLIEDIKGRQILAAFREIDVDTTAVVLGDGLFIYLQQVFTKNSHLKTPLGFNFVGKTVEVVVI